VVSIADIESAERVIGIAYTAAERVQMVENLEGQIASAISRRKFRFDNSMPTATRFDPRLPEKLRLFIVRMPRDGARIGEIEREVTTLNNEIDTVCEQLGVTANLGPIGAFTENGSSRQDPNVEMVQVEETSRPAELRELLSKEMYG